MCKSHTGPGNSVRMHRIVTTMSVAVTKVNVAVRTVNSARQRLTCTAELDPSLMGGSRTGPALPFLPPDAILAPLSGLATLLLRRPLAAAPWRLAAKGVWSGETCSATSGGVRGSCQLALSGSPNKALPQDIPAAFEQSANYGAAGLTRAGAVAKQRSGERRSGGQCCQFSQPLPALDITLITGQETGSKHSASAQRSRLSLASNIVADKAGWRSTT